jgi:uncharacterized membrane protein YgdD (TMEM256/DUF423 family)
MIREPRLTREQEPRNNVDSSRRFFAIGSALAGLAVAAGAFGAHGLDGRIEARLVEVFETGARYQLAHGLALLAVAWAVTRWPSAGLEIGGWLMVGGVIVFSTTLYLVALTGVTWFGAITPIGGVLMIAGWAVLAWRALRRSDLDARHAIPGHQPPTSSGETDDPT